MVQRLQGDECKCGRPPGGELSLNLKTTMEWFTLDEELIAEAFNEREAEKLQETRHSLPADPVPGICAGLAARVRQSVLAGGRCRLQGTELEIPLCLRNEATALLRVKLLTRFALSITEERKREAEVAEQLLTAIAKGEYPLPDDTVAAAPTYHGRPHRWCHPGMGGVMRRGCR